MMQKPNSTTFGCLALALLVFAAFGPVFANEFVSFDDPTYVRDNPPVRAGLSWAAVKWAFQTTTANNWHPVTWLSHALDCQVYGLRPWGHHLTNLLLHNATTLLLFLLFNHITGATGRSWFAAALFGLHPLRVESVAWAAERKDVLSGLFFMLTLWAYCRYARSFAGNLESGGSSRKTSSAAPQHSVLRAFRSPAYLLALAFYVLGLLSKQMLVTLPFVLLLLDVWPLRRFPLFRDDRSTAAPQNKRVVVPLVFEKLPFFVVAALFSVIVFLVQSKTGATGMMRPLPLAARVENALVSCPRYLIKLVWPADLAVFYPHPGTWPLSIVLGSAALLAAITAVGWLLRKTHPYLLVGWLWFLGMLVPVLGLVQVGLQSIADRYTYLPSIGLCFALVWTVAGLAQSRRTYASVLPGLGAAVVLICGLLTLRQVGFWKNTESLFRHAIDAVPGNYLAHADLADCLQLQGRLDEAFREVDEALRLNPDDVNTRNNYGSVLLKLGRVDEAIGQFQEAIRRSPRFAAAHSNLAFAYQGQGRLDQALAEFQSALECAPGDFRLRVNLAGVLLKLGRAPEAIDALDQAVRLEPADPAIRKDLGSLLANAGRLQEAVGQYEAATRLAGSDAESEANLGLCLSRLGRSDEALRHLRRALQLRPGYPEAQAELLRLEQR